MIFGNDGDGMLIDVDAVLYRWIVRGLDLSSCPSVRIGLRVWCTLSEAKSIALGVAWHGMVLERLFMLLWY